MLDSFHWSYYLHLHFSEELHAFAFALELLFCCQGPINFAKNKSTSWFRARKNSWFILACCWHDCYALGAGIFQHKIFSFSFFAKKIIHILLQSAGRRLFSRRRSTCCLKKKKNKKEKSVFLLATYVSLFLPAENFSGTAIREQRIWAERKVEKERLVVCTFPIDFSLGLCGVFVAHGKCLKTKTSVFWCLPSFIKSSFRTSPKKEKGWNNLDD